MQQEKLTGTNCDLLIVVILTKLIATNPSLNNQTKNIKNMQQSSIQQLAAMQSHMGNGGLSFTTIALLILAYATVMSLVLKTFQYLKERDFTQYK